MINTNQSSAKKSIQKQQLSAQLRSAPSEMNDNPVDIHKQSPLSEEQGKVKEQKAYNMDL